MLIKSRKPFTNSLFHDNINVYKLTVYMDKAYTPASSKQYIRNGGIGYAKICEFRWRKDKHKNMVKLAIAIVWALYLSYKCYLDYRKAITHEDTQVKLKELDVSAHDKDKPQSKKHHTKWCLMLRFKC